jgi:hypothetical protein
LQSRRSDLMDKFVKNEKVQKRLRSHIKKSPSRNVGEL